MATDASRIRIIVWKKNGKFFSRRRSKTGALGEIFGPFAARPEASNAVKIMPADQEARNGN